MSNTLAWWHTYNYCVKEIWAKFANQLWAPMWHHLYPNSKFYVDSTSMPSMCMHFMFMLLVWPEVKPLLMTAKTAPGLTGKGRVFLEDLEFLCEWAIPQVGSLVCVCAPVRAWVGVCAFVWVWTGAR
jgi:hypothetical protein